MGELKIICEYPESIRQLIEEVVTQKLRSIEDGLHRTQERLKEFETKYQLSTEEFLHSFENDELQHRLDMEFDEWIGESWMLQSLRGELEQLRGIKFVN